MKILVTGGAGYIGSICVEELLKQKREVIVIDNLQEGHRAAVTPGATFYKCGIGNCGELEEIFRKHDIETVIHFAAETRIENSMSDPHLYFQSNVADGLTLLDVMRRYDCRRIIFSSTAAIFGKAEYIPIDEKHPKIPINAYGESKLMFEKILDWYHTAYGFECNTFRYFNAAGASDRLGEAHRHESHLIPLIIKTALAQRKMIRIFGSDYNTKDGTCVRDYLHVLDIAQAHILGLDNLKKRPNAKYNLGNEVGFTNLDVLRKVAEISGKKINHEFTGRRPGDPDRLVCSSKLAREELGWKPKFGSFESIISSAWKWHSSHPNGYGYSD